MLLSPPPRQKKMAKGKSKKVKAVPKKATKSSSKVVLKSTKAKGTKKLAKNSFPEDFDWVSARDPLSENPTVNLFLTLMLSETLSETHTGLCNGELSDRGRAR